MQAKFWEHITFLGAPLQSRSSTNKLLLGMSVGNRLENEILNLDEKLKEKVTKFFLDNFEVLATHPSQYGQTKVLQMKIDLVPGVIP